MRRALLPLLAAFSLACGDKEGDDSAAPVEEVLPGDIAVSPAALDWGTVVVGVGAVEQVQIGNRGSGSLTVASVTIEPDDSGFAVRSAPRRVQQ